MLIGITELPYAQIILRYSPTPLVDVRKSLRKLSAISNWSPGVFVIPMLGQHGLGRFLILIHLKQPAFCLDSHLLP